MAGKLKKKAEYIFINNNSAKDIESVLHNIIIEKLLNQKFSFQKPMKEAR